MNPRRSFFKSIFGLAAISRLAAAQEPRLPVMPVRPAAPPQTPSMKHEHPVESNPVPVQSPDLKDLPFTLDNGVKVFNLIAEPVKQQLAPDKTIDVWGYNGSAPGPTIQVNQGDRVRIVFDNHLPEPTAMHWHGFEIPAEMDGAPGVTQDSVKPGGRFVYEFTLHQEGTYFYHPHMAMQEMNGMLGAFIMHPKASRAPKVDKDFVILLQEYAVLPNNTVPNTANMEFNWLVFNGKAGPATTPLIIRLGDRVRVRLVNLGMDHHPIHLHGHTFYVTGTEGGPIPQSQWYPGNTVLVGVAQARDVEFVADNPGDWMLHCHLPHHMMNQMSSSVGPMTRFGSGSDRTVANTPLSADKAKAMEQGMQHDMPGMQHSGMQMKADVSPNANSVPGFPQDAYMEGPMMAMDEMVQKPENHGLRPGWSGFMAGMMTFVRILPPAKYDEMMERIRKGQPAGMQHHQM